MEGEKGKLTPHVRLIKEDLVVVYLILLGIVLIGCVALGWTGSLLFNVIFWLLTVGPIVAGVHMQSRGVIIAGGIFSTLLEGITILLWTTQYGTLAPPLPFGAQVVYQMWVNQWWIGLLLVVCMNTMGIRIVPDSMKAKIIPSKPQSAPISFTVPKAVEPEIPKSPDTTGRFWKCPHCGDIWAKEEFFMMLNPMNLQGTNTCACGRIYDQREVYGGQFDYPVIIKRNSPMGSRNSLNIVIFTRSRTPPPLYQSRFSTDILQMKYPHVSVGTGLIIGLLKDLREEETFAMYLNLVRIGSIRAQGDQVDIFSGEYPPGVPFTAIVFTS